MSIKENKTVIYRVFEEVTKGNLDIIDEYFADGFIRRAADGTETGRDTYKQICGFLLKTFPDFRIAVDDIVAEGDRTAFRFTWSGTMQGAGGKHIAVTEDYFCRFKDGKIIEFDNLLDELPGYQARLEENKTLVRRALETWNRDRNNLLDIMSELVTPMYVEHYTDVDLSLEQVKQAYSTFLAAFPDITVTINDIVAEGDKVAVRATWKGTHKGQIFGIAPTGNRIDMTNTSIFRIANGKLAELWTTQDSLRMLQQLGVIPKM